MCATPSCLPGASRLSTSTGLTVPADSSSDGVSYPFAIVVLMVDSGFPWADRRSWLGERLALCHTQLWAVQRVEFAMARCAETLIAEKKGQIELLMESIPACETPQLTTRHSFISIFGNTDNPAYNHSFDLSSSWRALSSSISACW